MTIRPKTGVIIGNFQRYLINELPWDFTFHCTPPSSTILTIQAPRVNNASDRIMVILSGSNMRLENILKKIGTIQRVASQAASIIPRQYRLSFVGMNVTYIYVLRVRYHNFTRHARQALTTFFSKDRIEYIIYIL